MMRLFKLLVLLSCLATALFAQAQDTLAWSIALDDVVVTAQYAPTSSKEAVHQVEVVKAEEWQARGQNTLSELLQQQLNMRVGIDPVLGNGLAIQGLGGQNVQILIDGVPVVGRLGGNIDLNQLNLSQFERVEIVTGSMAAQYGSNAAGGVINLISKKYQINQWQFEAGAQLESFGLQNQFARIGRKIGPVQIDGGVNRFVADFARVDSLRVIREVEIDTLGNTTSERIVPWNPKDQLGYDVNLSYRPSDSLHIRYGYRAFDEELLIYGPIQRPSFRPYAIDQSYDTERRDHHLSVEYWLTDQLYWKTTAGINRFERFKKVGRLSIEPDTTQLLEEDTTVYTGKLIRSSLSWLGTKAFSSRLGLEYLRETGAGGRIRDPETDESEPAIVNAAAWLSLQYKFTNALTAEANFRYGHNSRYDHPFIPSLNLMWQPSPRLQWRFGYAKGFRAPSIQELFFEFIDINHNIIGNPDANAEVSDNLRTDISWQAPSNNSSQPWLSMDAALFYNSIRDRLILVEEPDEILDPEDPDSPRGCGCFTYSNFDEFETRGLNLGLNIRPLKDLELQLGGAYRWITNRAHEDDPTVDPFIGQAEMTNTLSYRFQPLLMDIQLVHRFLGKQERYTTDIDGNVTQGFIEDYHLVDLSIQQSWQGKITLGAGIKNLFDQDRVGVSGGPGGGAHSGATGSRLVAFGRNFFVRGVIKL